MIILTLNTEHYYFQAAGEDDAEAKCALEMALTYHSEALSLDPKWWIGHYDIERLEIRYGECFRDGQLLYRKA